MGPRKAAAVRARARCSSLRPTARVLPPCIILVARPGLPAVWISFIEQYPVWDGLRGGRSGFWHGVRALYPAQTGHHSFRRECNCDVADELPGVHSSIGHEPAFTG